MTGFKTTDDAWRQWTRTDVKKFKVSVYLLINGSYQAFVKASNMIPKDAIKLKPQPPYPRDNDPRMGTKQAMEQLEGKHPREVDWACYFAVQLILRNLTTHSRAVREEMERRGLVDANASEFWLGAAMNKLARLGILEKSGHTYKYSDSSRGIHERTITVWQLKDGANTKEFEKEPNFE